MAAPGQELTDPVSGARLRFLATGPVVRMRLAVSSGWSAGPLHVHPRQTERLRVVSGSFQAQFGPRRRQLGAGDEIAVPTGTPHTIALLGRDGELEVEFEPGLRTGEMFETMYSADFPRRPPAFVPPAIRAWIESVGFRDEIRFLWPRRAAALVAAVSAGAILAAWSRR
jgi:mannose-6-phosphate isomerase-like protein (cupin superfamily)